jgi:ribosomal-protein-alanine N-acetyltransferase
MIAADVDRVVAIESESFTNPWRGDTFHALLDRPGAELWVLDSAGTGLVAYAVLWCILDQGELANIAVARIHRGQGHGARLLLKMLEIGRARGIRSVYLEVRASNARAIEFYRDFGFEEIGVRKGYYDLPTEDALLMVLQM